MPLWRPDMDWCIKMKRFCAIVLLGAMALCLCACGAGAERLEEVAATAGTAPEGAARFLFINVGKADSMLISADGKNYLVDVGEKESVPAILGALCLMEVEALDGVFLTHTHSDHAGGMELLAENIPVAMLYHAEFTELTDKGVNEFEKLSEKLGIPHETLSAGMMLTLGENVTAEVIAPLVPNAEDDNDQSLVLMVSVHGRKLLLTGDMQFAEEQTLLDAGVDLKADVLKVGNHGNPDATSEAFAAAVSPLVAVISTDTSVDEDSANPRVIAALGDAAVHVTQDCHVGVLVTVDDGGELGVTGMLLADAPAVALENVSKETQTAVIRNAGPGVDVSGYMLFSDKGKELYVFPEGTILPQDGMLTVACEGGSGDLIWTGENQVWHTSKEDVAVLYDAFGRELSRLASE